MAQGSVLADLHAKKNGVNFTGISSLSSLRCHITLGMHCDEPEFHVKWAAQPFRLRSGALNTS